MTQFTGPVNELFKRALQKMCCSIPGHEISAEASEQIDSSGLPRDSDAITIALFLPIRLHITEETYVYISDALQGELT